MPRISKAKVDKSIRESTSTKTKEVKSDTKTPWYWIKNSSGKASASITFAFVSFWVTTVLYVLSSIKSCGDTEFREFDSAAVGAYLIPILTLYFGRRWTETKLDVESRNQHSLPEVTPDQQ